MSTPSNVSRKAIVNATKQTELTFFSLVQNELKRARRYRVFLSMVVLDLRQASVGEEAGNGSGKLDLTDLLAENVREIDCVADLSERVVGVLLPETPRQGAEIVGRRMTELVRSHLSLEESAADTGISMEMASYPDTSGAKTIADFIREHTGTDLT
jgi:GGDEF domain-containing protein